MRFALSLIILLVCGSFADAQQILSRDRAQFKDKEYIQVWVNKYITPDHRRQQRAISVACQQWGRVINKKFYWARKPENADIVFDVGGAVWFVGKKRNILATTHDYIDKQHIVMRASNKVQVRMKLHSLILHELGHALGLKEHTGPGTVMDPYPTRSSLSHADVVRIRKLYGIE